MNEKYGIICRIPNWWKNRTGTVKLNISVGNASEVYCQTVSGVSVTSSGTASGELPSSSGWKHVSVVRSGTSCKVYINGIDKTTSFGVHTSMDANNQALAIGKRSDASDYFYGQIDEVKIYNYAMTAAQINREYNNGAVFFGPATGSP